MGVVPTPRSRGRRGRRRGDDPIRYGTVRRPRLGVSIETPTEEGAATARRDHAPPDRRGFALLAVLWLIVVLGAIAGDFQTGARADVRLAANARAAARARWAAHAGLARTLDALDRVLAGQHAVQLLAAAGDTLIPPLQFESDGIRVRAVARDARARLNINAVSRAELLRLLGALGVPEPKAQAYVNAVLAARIARGGAPPEGVRAAHAVDDVELSLARRIRSRLSGAARGATRAAARSEARAAELAEAETSVDLPFHAVEDVPLWADVAPEVHAVVAPYLTAVGDGRINVNSAPAPVLRALPSMDAAAAAAILRRRRVHPFTNAFDVLAALPRGTRAAIGDDPAEWLDRMATGPRVVEVTVDARPESARAGSRIAAELRLLGGAGVEVVRVVER
jgi:type II secretory pathway component PulK